jgi:hypothetical protein
LSVIDAFGDAYGWSKTQINEVYPEEAITLLKNINKRMRAKLAHDMQGWALTVLAPNASKPGDLIEMIYRQIEQLLGIQEAEKPYWQVTELDRDALKRAKENLQKVNESRKG